MTDRLLEVFVSTAAFVYFGGILATILTAVAALPVILAMPFFGFHRTRQMVIRIAVFVFLLHTFSLMANVVFVAGLRNRLYYSADPIIDWLPYMPASGFATDPACGGHLLNGFSESAFTVAWIALAVPVWLATVVVFRRVTCNNQLEKRA